MNYVINGLIKFLKYIVMVFYLKSKLWEGVKDGFFNVVYIV